MAVYVLYSDASTWYCFGSQPLCEQVFPFRADVAGFQNSDGQRILSSFSTELLTDSCDRSIEKIH